jgi:hypothetical protein
MGVILTFFFFLGGGGGRQQKTRPQKSTTEKGKNSERKGARLLICKLAVGTIGTPDIRKGLILTAQILLVGG